MKEVARWATRGAKFWITLYENKPCEYRYKTDNGGGWLVATSEAAAIRECEERVEEARRYDGINMKRKAE